MTLSQHINGGLRRVPVWLLYAIAIVPPVWLFYQGVTGGLGVDPVKGLELSIGKLGLQVLVASLAITPLRKFTGVSLIRFRRAISLIGFTYIFLHLLVWLVLDVQIVSQIWADILKRPIITIGMSAFALMIPLAATSNNWSLRKLGPVRWRRLHKLTYLVLVLGGIHYTLISKVWQPEALAYLAFILLLLATRLPFAKWLARLRVRPGGQAAETP